MGSKLTSTNRSRLRSAGFALVEALIAIGITGLLLAVLASVSMLSGRTFAAFANYVDLDDANRIAMDTLARDLRECNRVTACTATRLDIEDPGGFTVRYEYSSATQKLIRTGAGGVQRVMLKGCDTLEFHLGTRNPDGNTFSVLPTTDVNFAKVVNVSWNCSRSILGKKANTENVQTARIVIRRQSPP